MEGEEGRWEVGVDVTVVGASRGEGASMRGCVQGENALGAPGLREGREGRALREGEAQGERRAGAPGPCEAARPRAFGGEAHEGGQPVCDVHLRVVHQGGGGVVYMGEKGTSGRG